MAIYKRGVIQSLVFFAGVEILTTLVPDMLESQLKALKTRIIV